MNKRIQKLLIVSFFLLLNIELFAQDKIKIKSEKEYQLFFNQQLRSYHDSLSKILNDYLLFSVRFKIQEGGGIDSIYFSINKPSVLLEAVKQALMKIQFIQSSQFVKNTWYVQPFEFNFLPNPTPQIIDNKIYLCYNLPVVDTANFESNLKIAVTFNGFYEVSQNDKSIWGLQCVLLPPVKFFRTLVYR